MIEVLVLLNRSPVNELADNLCLYYKPILLLLSLLFSPGLFIEVCQLTSYFTKQQQQQKTPPTLFQSWLTHNFYVLFKNAVIASQPFD